MTFVSSPRVLVQSQCSTVLLDASTGSVLASGFLHCLSIYDGLEARGKLESFKTKDLCLVLNWGLSPCTNPLFHLR